MNAKIAIPSSNGVLNVGGECFNSVIKNLRSATSEKSATVTKRKAADVVMNCIKAYQKVFGGDDVGLNGTGRVANRFQGGMAPEGTNGLMYGRVQSGKTNASIASVALANANGFKCFLILTSDNIWLGKQTVDRFRDQLGAGGGPIVRSWEDWRANPTEFSTTIAPYLQDVGVVLITTKNSKNLENLNVVLKQLDAGSVPGLILDDEADNASLNTNTAKMARGKTEEPSRIFGLIGEIREAMPNHIFVQVTATPQSLLLQGLNHPSRPSWVVMIDPGEDYIGGERFFGADTSHIVPVEPDELDLLKAGKVAPGSKWEMPPGLARAVCCFVVGAAFRSLETDASEALSMLIHIDHKKVTHKAVKEVVTSYILYLDQALRGKLSASDEERARVQILAAYDELQKSCPQPPAFDAVLEKLKSNLRNADPQIIDADNPNQKPDYRKGMNFLIGGNRLGRGVTIEGLTVTYYGRDAKTKMMDAVHQHARMFGYRKHLLKITRLYSPRHIVGSLKDIYLSDEGTRRLLEKNGKLSVKPVWVGPELKATRANVLNPAELTAVVGDKAIFPISIVYQRAKLKSLVPALEHLLIPFADPNEYYDVSVEFLGQLLELMPSEPRQRGTWDDERIRQILTAMKTNPLNIPRGMLNVRRGLRGGSEGFANNRLTSQTSGFAEGTQINDAKARYPGMPILLLRKQAGAPAKEWDNHPLYTPTLIVPKTDFVFVFITN